MVLKQKKRRNIMPRAKTAKDTVETVKSVSETAAKRAKKVTDSALKTAKEVSDSAAKTAKEVTDSAVKIAKEVSANTVDKVKETLSLDALSERKIYVQYFGKQISEEEITKSFKEIWLKEHKLSEIKDLKVYYKVEDQKAYFVINDSETIEIDFF
jgi:hypothetical protein